LGLMALKIEKPKIAAINDPPIDHPDFSPK
jgi:hypothetical protein